MKNLLNNNKKEYFQSLNNNRYCFIVSRGRYVNDICNIFSFIAANKVLKVNPVVISDPNQKKYDEIFGYFGIKNLKYIFTYKKILNEPKIFFLSLIQSIYCTFFTFFKGFDWLINKFSIKNIKVGDLIYDTHIRENHGYIDPKIDLNFLNKVFKCCFRTIKLLKLTNTYKPKIIFIGTDGYAYNSGIMMRIGIALNIKTIETQQNFVLEVPKFKAELGSDHLNCVYKKNKFQIPKKKIIQHYRLKIKRKKKVIGYSSTDTFFLANKHKDRNKNEVLKRLSLKENDRYDKIILIASHAFSDAPHVTGYQIFTDYYQHILETLKFIKSNKFEKKILWIIKEHPASFVYNENLILNKLSSRFISKNIILSPKDINTYDLMKICDNVITTKGTIALEFAAEGKTSILAGASSFSHLGFTIDPKNKSDYFKKLLNIDKLKKLNQLSIFKAKKAMYFLDKSLHKNHLKKSEILIFSDVRDVYLRNLLKGKVKGNQVKFIKKALQNLRKKKIYNDPYFKSLEDFFNKKNIS